MTYSEWVVAMVTLGQISDADGQTAFTALAPRAISYAEELIYDSNDLDFDFTRCTDISQQTTTGLRSVPIPPSISVAGFSGSFVVVEGVSLIVPANSKPNPAVGQTSGTRVPLLRTSRPFLDMMWPQESQTHAPTPYETYYALYSQQNASDPTDPSEPVPMASAILIGPTPDSTYVVEFSGVGRPTPLSSTNTTTFLTTYVPELFVAASMLWWVGYQRDTGANAMTPGLAEYWGQQFNALKESASQIISRQKGMANGSTALPPVTASAMPRGSMPAPAPVGR